MAMHRSMHYAGQHGPTELAQLNLFWPSHEMLTRCCLLGLPRLAPTTTLRSTTIRSSSTQPFPRAAVAVTLMREVGPQREYLLVQRAKPPNAGSWSLPGGKIELSETTFAAGARELVEEASLGAREGVRFHPHAFAMSDVIVEDSGSLQFHYVITQLFAWCTDAAATAYSGDDAAGVRWVTLAEAEDGSIRLGGNVCGILRRAEAMLECGALDLDDALPPIEDGSPPPETLVER